MVEYRWHPLYGKRLPLYRRTDRNDVEVVHVQSAREAPRELPSWMVDASSCLGMELGPPQVSIAALIELRALVKPASREARVSRGFVLSLDEEGEPIETAAKAIPQAVDAAIGARNTNSTGRGSKRGSDPNPRRPVAGSDRHKDRTANGGRAQDE